MPDELIPGVYVKESDLKSRPIEGLSTSTAGFIGSTHSGPLNKVVGPITSFRAFRQIYGGLESLHVQGIAKFAIFRIGKKTAESQAEI